MSVKLLHTVDFLPELGKGEGEKMKGTYKFLFPFTFNLSPTSAALVAFAHRSSTLKDAAYSTLKNMEDTLFNRTFRDSQGEIVLAQMPNMPILVWLAATLLNHVSTTGNIHTG